MSSSLAVSYHTTGPNELERGTSVTVREQSGCATVGIGKGGELAEITFYVDRAAEAFALARAFASAGDLLEARQNATRAAEVPAEPWAEVPLPL